MASRSGMRPWTGLALLWLLLAQPAHSDELRRLPRAQPDEMGMSVSRLRAIDELVAEGLDRNRMPGAVVCIGHKGHIVLLKAYGNRQLQPEPRAMTVDTVFDMASITKPVATATSVMQLAERGKIRLEAPVAQYLPEFAQNGKQDITIYQLLTHQGGLIPDNALKDYADGPAKALERIYALQPSHEPGSKFVYSDVGFIVLAEVVRRVSGQDINAWSRQNLFAPLGMLETGFLPTEPLRQRAAATQQRDGRWMIGEVHDPRAWRLGGVAGHAGLFSTAEDLAVFAQTLLNGGALGTTRILKPETVTRMTRGYDVGRGLRGLGWDVQSSYSSNRGDLLSHRAFGHGGFTGTVLWMDPELELFVIFLSNRVHPDGDGSVNTLAGRIGTIAAAAIGCTDAYQTGNVHKRRQKPEVLCGIDVLQRDGFPLLAGRKVGLITNHTGVDRAGRSTVELLHEAKSVDLRALFSPEHGFAGRLDVARIADTRDSATGLEVFSLYGETRQPTAEQLASLDTLVFDIQDIGTRFYTYVSTMGLAMEAAAREQKRFVVLDRPNPINGRDVQGPVLDAGAESFVGYHRVPVRHGMTAGELARMIRDERGLELDLHVVPLEGWTRSMHYDQTGLSWINPSPNMRSLTQATLYPGIGLLETTNLSVGRGTDTPFELIGAPWIDARKLAEALNAAGLQGVRFLPRSFVPDASRFANETCYGINIMITDRERFDPLRCGFLLAWQLHRLFPQQWQVERYGRLLGNQAVLEALQSGKHPDELRIIYEPELDAFRARRTQYLLY